MNSSGPLAKQLLLFRSDRATPELAPIDADSEQLLEAFHRARIAEGAHRRSVAREVSQLRELAREAALHRGQASLVVLLIDVELLAQLLLEPSRPIARSTGRVRLLAIQRFIRVVGPTLGRDSQVDLAALDALLPSRPSTGWHTAGTVVAGVPGRRRRRAPTLDVADLHRIVDQAGVGLTGLRAARDRALVALHCFSGLRAEEVASMRWEDLKWQRTPAGHYGLVASVARRSERLSILIPGPAAAAIRSLCEHLLAEPGGLRGPVFRSRSRTEQQLSYRTARAIVARACRRASLPAIGSVELRAAYAAWLKVQGLSDHEVADVLGLARVRSVDNLLRRHAALSAQRAVRERIDR